MTPLLSNMSPDDMRVAMAELDWWTEIYPDMTGRPPGTADATL